MCCRLRHYASQLRRFWSTICWILTGGKLLNEFCLDLLNLKQPLPLVSQQHIQLGVHLANLKFCFQVHSIIMLSANSVLGFLTVLTHHDDGSLN